MSKPSEIYKHQLNLINKDAEIANLQSNLRKLEGEIEMAIAREENLRNDQQRKARKFELEAEMQIDELRTQLREFIYQRNCLQAELDLAHNSFVCWKLSERRAIAELELTASLNG